MSLYRIIVKRRRDLLPALLRSKPRLQEAATDAVADALRDHPFTPRDTGRGASLIRADKQFVKAPDYMVYLDQGVAPFRAFPPPQKMEAWGRRVIGKSGLGFVLARSIWRKGIKARKYVGKYGTEALRKSRKRLAVILAGEMRNALHK